MSLSKITATAAFAALLASTPVAFAQSGGADGSAGSSVTGTSNGKQGAPTVGTTGRSSTSGTSAGSMSNGHKMDKSGDATGMPPASGSSR